MTRPTRRVLLIEDSPTYGKLATVLLTHCGCTVVRAATAEEGLRLARLEATDLVLLDINLPDGDGHEVVRTLREDPRTRLLPVVGLTADRVWGEAEQRTARLAGFSAFVEKPTDEATYRRLVDGFLPPSRAAG